MVESVELKRIQITGTAVLKNGEITGFVVARPTASGFLVEPAVLSKVASVGDLIKSAFAAGDQVTVIDGCRIDATIGSPSGCAWRGKETCVGKTGEVVRVDTDGDVVVSGLAQMLFSPEFLRKVTPFFKVGAAVICDQSRSGHPGWIPAMDATVGRVGIVLAAAADRVHVYCAPAGQFFYFTDWVRWATKAEINANRSLHSASQALETASPVALAAESVGKRPRSAE